MFPVSAVEDVVARLGEVAEVWDADMVGVIGGVEGFSSSYVSDLVVGTGVLLIVEACPQKLWDVHIVGYE